MSTDQQAGHSTVTTPSEREIYVERVFDATPDRVFAAFTDREQVAQWWGQRDTTTTVEEMDVRPGGSWRFVQRGEDGSEYAFRGIYREVSPPERLEQTFEYEGMPGHVCLEKAVFEDLGDGRTRMKSTTLFYLTEERDGMLEAGMEKGMNESFEQLDELLAA